MRLAGTNPFRKRRYDTGVLRVCDFENRFLLIGAGEEIFRDPGPHIGCGWEHGLVEVVGEGGEEGFRQGRRVGLGRWTDFKRHVGLQDCGTG